MLGRPMTDADAGRTVATGGLGWFADPARPRAEQARVYEHAADRRVSNLYVAVDLIGRGIGRRRLHCWVDPEVLRELGAFAKGSAT